MLNKQILQRIEDVTERLTREHTTKRIPVTEEAQALLSPYYSALLASHKAFYFAGREYSKEEVMHKCVADAMALTDLDGLCGCNEGVVDARVAKIAIKELKMLGIGIKALTFFIYVC